MGGRIRGMFYVITGITGGGIGEGLLWGETLGRQLARIEYPVATETFFAAPELWRESLFPTKFTVL